MMSDRGELSTGEISPDVNGYLKTSLQQKSSSIVYNDGIETINRQPEIAPFLSEPPASVRVEQSPDGSNSSQPLKGRGVALPLPAISRRGVVSPRTSSTRQDGHIEPAKPVFTYTAPRESTQYHKNRPASPSIVPTPAYVEVVSAPHRPDIQIPIIHPQPIRTIYGSSPHHAQLQPQTYTFGRPQSTLTQQRPDYKNMTPEQQQEEHQLFKSKFTTLRRSNPGVHFDEPAEDSSLDFKHTEFEKIVRDIMVDKSRLRWRTYLAVMFAGIEIFCFVKLGYNISGYAEMEMDSMDDYDAMLIELGKNWLTTGANIPVEIRIVGTALVNAGILVLLRTLTDKLGDGGEIAYRGLVSGIRALKRRGFAGAPVSVHVPAGTVAQDGSVIPVDSTTAPSAGFDMNNLGGSIQSIMQMLGGQGQGGNMDIGRMITQATSMFTSAMAAPTQPPIKPPTRQPLYR